MTRILILGAGLSAPALIDHLLQSAEERGRTITVADLDEARARAHLRGHPRGHAISLDASDDRARARCIAEHDLVISFLHPALHFPVALDCLSSARHLVTASYTTRELRELDGPAREKGLTFLFEMGLDPGIDHMSTMALLDELRAAGESVLSFRSYGAGIADPDTCDNPLGYYITWNPKNVVLAGKDGAQWFEGGAERAIPHAEVLRQTWPVEVPNLGTFEAYANRDSLGYVDTFGLREAQTVVRATLRPFGFCELWSALLALGWMNDGIEVQNLAARTRADMTRRLIGSQKRGEALCAEAANALRISATGGVMQKLRWLGVFEEEPLAMEGGSYAAILAKILEQKLRRPADGRDLVILQHDIITRPEGSPLRSRRILATLIQRGDPMGFTAMAKTVGLPAAIGADLILSGRISARGVTIPTTPEIYRPVLEALAQAGIRFEERTEWL